MTPLDWGIFWSIFGACSPPAICLTQVDVEILYCWQVIIVLSICPSLPRGYQLLAHPLWGATHYTNVFL